ncbi:hypothetical protein Tco_1529786, partial [Tanacetum coccineum]
VLEKDLEVSKNKKEKYKSLALKARQVLEHEQSPIIYQGFEDSQKTSTFHDDPLNESPQEDSTSQGSSSNMRQLHTPFEHLGRWTKDHPIANVIGDPSHSVSTRKQLEALTRFVPQSEYRIHANNLTPLNVKCILIKLVTQGKVGIVSPDRSIHNTSVYPTGI